MAGLTSSGFEPETLSEIQERIKGKLEQINPGFDFSPESPDGQLIEIMSFELWTAWNQLSMVYNSFNPALATGSALRNIGLITGAPFGNANRSYATIETQGTAGTLIPKNSLVADADGFEYYLANAVTVPNNAQVVCLTPGDVPVPANTITSIVSTVSGWTGVTQTTDGVIGSQPMTDQEYRNRRTATIMRNYTSTVDTMQARLLELGVEQATVYNNSDVTTQNGVPANTVAVTIGDQAGVTDESIASVIFETNAVGCPTHGTTLVPIVDQQGYSHDVRFTKAVAVPIELVVDVTYLSDDSAGAAEAIQEGLLSYVNGLLAGEDVVWSRLFQYITPYAKAKVNTLTVGTVAAASPGTIDVPISDTEFATLAIGNISFSET